MDHRRFDLALWLTWIQADALAVAAGTLLVVFVGLVAVLGGGGMPEQTLLLTMASAVAGAGRGFKPY